MLLSLVMALATAQANETLEAPAEAVAMQRLLSSRHAVPCEEIEATSATPRESLIWMVENTKYPAWAGMRAAQCLIDNHATASKVDFERWASEESFRGLARMMLVQIDALPEPVAIGVATKVLENYPDTDLVVTKLAKSSRPAVAALVADRKPAALKP